MLNDTDYTMLYLMKQQSKELDKALELGLILESAKKRTVISQVMEGAGKALVSTGNRLLKIA